MMNIRILVPVFLVLQSAAALADDRPAVPDLTKGGRPDKAHDWTLGPTGLRGQHDREQQM